MSRTTKFVLAFLFSAALTLSAQEVVYRLGGAAPRNVELVSDGNVYFRISPTGAITLPNSAAFAAAALTSSSNVTYAAGNFTANGTQTWTVDEADVALHHWVRVGNIVTLNWQVITSTVGGSANTQLRVGSGGFTWARSCESSHYYLDNNTRGSSRAYATAGTTYVVLNIATAGNWAAATNTTYTFGQITCEVS